METPKAKKHHSKKLLIALIFLVLLAGVGIGVWLLFFQDRGDSGQVMYREYTVARGDLTIGLSESGTVSLSREIISQPVDVTVTDISVAVGDHVAEGDIVAVLSEASVKKRWPTMIAALHRGKHLRPGPAGCADQDRPSQAHL